MQLGWYQMQLGWYQNSDFRWYQKKDYGSITQKNTKQLGLENLRGKLTLRGPFRSTSSRPPSCTRNHVNKRNLQKLLCCERYTPHRLSGIVCVSHNGEQVKSTKFLRTPKGDKSGSLAPSTPRLTTHARTTQTSSEPEPQTTNGS